MFCASVLPTTRTPQCIEWKTPYVNSAGELIIIVKTELMENVLSATNPLQTRYSVKRRFIVSLSQPTKGVVFSPVLCLRDEDFRRLRSRKTPSG